MSEQNLRNTWYQSIDNQNKIVEQQSQNQEIESLVLDLNRSTTSVKLAQTLLSEWIDLTYYEDSFLWYKVWKVDILHIAEKLLPYVKTNVELKATGEEQYLKLIGIATNKAFRQNDIDENGLLLVTLESSVVVYSSPTRTPQIQARLTVQIVNPEQFI